MSLEHDYKVAISSVLQTTPDKIFLYWKGRVGLFALLKAKNIDNGDEVIMPAFTCVVVPNAVLYTGATPVYCDIDPATLNTTLDIIKKKISSHTKCIIIQNTFGLSSEVDEITSYAREKGIFTIEDCTHGFGGTFNNAPNGSFCDASFFSTQWNKPFSTGLGGIVMVNNPELLQPLIEANKGLIKPKLTKSLMLEILIFFRKNLLNNTTYWFLLRLYRFLSKKGLVIGSSSNDEITSTKIPENYFMASCNTQAKHGINALKHLKPLLVLRYENSIKYNNFLKENGKIFYPENLLQNHSFLKFPVFVKNRNEFIHKAEKQKIQLGDWFVSPLHPLECELTPWKMEMSDFPVAYEKSLNILNLPSDTKEPEKVLQFLSDNINDLLNASNTN
ncbi:MAG: DegT/DnrJ/EryC1/StrS aminotransferase family protein [Bacteroidales bacterium]|nr:DegT/DnrJ/EryC1/StrS aminotransferase family protein [Bacteroidales bacterium]